MLRPSAGTANVLGLNKMKLKDPPTCAYVMVGNKCKGTCLFCAQRTDENNGKDKKADFLSRITWKPLDKETVLDKTVESFNNGNVKRVCFQVVQNRGAYKNTLESVKYLAKKCNIPICVSINGISFEQIKDLYNAGTEKIAFSFDAATPELYKEIKGKEFDDEWNLYIKVNKNFPGQTVIHLIAGLGETGEEMVKAIETFYRYDSEVSLFAFTPIPGTPLSKKKQPSLKYYRKLQAALYLIRTMMKNEGNFSSNNRGKNDEPKTVKKTILKTPKNTPKNLDSLDTNDYCHYFTFDEGEIIFNPDEKDFLKSYIPSEAFQTYGCPDCNRPLYNEKPGKTPYNYPGELTDDELTEAIDLLFL